MSSSRTLQPHGRTTWRLAATYLSIMLIMSLGFSTVLYRVSSRELERQLPPDRLFSNQFRFLEPNGVQDFFQQRIDEGRQHLLQNLALLNVGVLTIGGLASYIVARRTLEPIETALEAQTRFTADAAHELRTPLATIQTENEIALRNPGLDLPRAKQLLRSNLEEVGRLHSLSETLLRLARSDNQAVPMLLGAVDLSTGIERAVHSLAQAAVQKHITFAQTISPTIAFANIHAVQEALAIVLDNAIKYSPEQTTITIATHTDTAAHIVITDQGQGITADDLPRIFERFYRANASRTKQQAEGLGLGLPLARQLLEAMHGEITVNSALGTGSTFTLTLPLTIDRSSGSTQQTDLDSPVT